MKNIKEESFFANTLNYNAWIHTSHISRHLALSDLYRKTINLPGSIIEFGVWRGSSFFLFAKLIEIFNSSSHETHKISNRHLYGFDTFEGFPDISNLDISKTHHKEKKPGGLNPDSTIFQEAYDYFMANSPINERVHLEVGDVTKTWDSFLEQNSGVRCCLAHLDLDLYEPTKVVLDKLLDVMVPNGIIVFDEYGYPEWPGETHAVDDFIKKSKLKLQHFHWSYGPGAFIILP